MSLQDEVYTALSGDAGVTALVSTRIYPDEAPQDSTLPLVIHQATAGEQLRVLSGARAGTMWLLSLTCWASTRAGANALRAAVDTALAGAGLYSIAIDDSIYDTTTGAYASVLTIQRLEAA